MKYPIYTPDIQRYTTSLHEAIQEGWISSQGRFLENARDICKEILNVPYVVLVNNGTSATHLLYKSLKFKYPELKRIYVPDFVFVAVWNCALYEYEPEQISVLKMDNVTLNMSVEDDYIQSIEPNSAVMIVHNIGNVVNVPRLKLLRPDLIFVEDCCEAFLETYNGEFTGTQSLCGAVSFFGNKMVTTGEGGLWYTHDKELYEFIYKSCHHGMTSERYVYDVLGYNYRMTNLQAALLFDQMQDIKAILHLKRTVKERYDLLLPRLGVTSGIWMYVIRLIGRSYSDFAKFMANHSIDTRPMFYSLHTHSHLRKIETITNDISHSELAMIPSSPGLTSYDQTYIAFAIRMFINNISDLSIHRITEENRELLDQFIAHEHPSTFRYFVSRTAETCFKDHTLTLIGTENGTPVCYAHIDDRWIGLCVLPESQGKGYGSLFLDFIMAYATLFGISSLRLTVDKYNDKAIQLYLRHGFRVHSSTQTTLYMIND